MKQAHELQFRLLEYKQLLNQLYKQPKMRKHINFKDKGKISKILIVSHAK